MSTRPPALWAFGGGKGGVGKTLVCASVAVEFARRGRRVVLLDADLGAANLHTLLGLLHPARTLGDFFADPDAGLEPCCVETSVEGLRLVSGAAAILRAAHPRPAEKRRLVDAMLALDADVVLLDLGAGTHYNTLDFFNVAGHRLVVTSAEPTSIQNAYAFIKAATFRRLELGLADAPWIAEPLARAIQPRGQARIESIDQLVAELGARDPGVADRARALVDTLAPRLVVNMAEPSARKRVEGALGVVCTRYLGVRPDHVATLPDDPAARRAVRRMRPVLVEAPDCPLADAVAALVDAVERRAADPRPHLLRDVAPAAADGSIASGGRRPFAPTAPPAADPESAPSATPPPARHVSPPAMGSDTIPTIAPYPGRHLTPSVPALGPETSHSIPTPLGEGTDEFASVDPEPTASPFDLRGYDSAEYEAFESVGSVQSVAPSPIEPPLAALDGGPADSVDELIDDGPMFPDDTFDPVPDDPAGWPRPQLASPGVDLANSAEWAAHGLADNEDAILAELDALDPADDFVGFDDSDEYSDAFTALPGDLDLDDAPVPAPVGEDTARIRVGPLYTFGEAEGLDRDATADAQTAMGDGIDALAGSDDIPDALSGDIPDATYDASRGGRRGGEAEASMSPWAPSDPPPAAPEASTADASEFEEIGSLELDALDAVHLEEPLSGIHDLSAAEGDALDAAGEADPSGFDDLEDLEALLDALDDEDAVESQRPARRGLEARQINAGGDETSPPAGQPEADEGHALSPARGAGDAEGERARSSEPDGLDKRVGRPRDPSDDFATPSPSLGDGPPRDDFADDPLDDLYLFDPEAGGDLDGLDPLRALDSADGVGALADRRQWADTAGPGAAAGPGVQGGADPIDAPNARDELDGFGAVIGDDVDAALDEEDGAEALGAIADGAGLIGGVDGLAALDDLAALEDLEGLEDREGFEALSDLDDLDALGDLDGLGELDDLGDPDGLDALGDPDGLDGLGEFDDLDGLGELDDLDALGDLDDLDGLGELDDLDGLGELDDLDGLGERDGLEALGEPDGLDALGESDGLADLDDLDGLGNLDALDDLEDIGRLDGSALDAPAATADDDATAGAAADPQVTAASAWQTPPEWAPPAEARVDDRPRQRSASRPPKPAARADAAPRTPPAGRRPSLTQPPSDHGSVERGSLTERARPPGSAAAAPAADDRAPDDQAPDDQAPDDQAPDDRAPAGRAPLERALPASSSNTSDEGFADRSGSVPPRRGPTDARSAPRDAGSEPPAAPRPVATAHDERPQPANIREALGHAGVRGVEPPRRSPARLPGLSASMLEVMAAEGATAGPSWRDEPWDADPWDDAALAAPLAPTPWAAPPAGPRRRPAPAVDDAREPGDPLADPPGHPVIALEELCETPDGALHLQTADLAPYAAMVRRAIYRDGELVASHHGDYEALIGADGRAREPVDVPARVEALHERARRALEADGLAGLDWPTGGAR